MISKKIKAFNSSLLVIIFTCLFFVSGSIYYSASNGTEIEPEVILIDSPTKLTSLQQQKLPTGYKWVTRQQVQRNYLNITGNMDRDLNEWRENPQIFFLLDEDLNMEEAIKYAKKNGKTEIYLKAGRPNPEEMVPLSIDDARNMLLKSIDTTVAGLEWILDPFIIKDARQ